MAWVIGFGFFLAWGILWLLEARWSALPAYDRPRMTHSPTYALWASVARKLILAISLLGLAVAHWAALAAVAALLVTGWSVRRVQSSAGSQRRSMQREFERLRRESPNVPDTELLFQIVFAQHARWGPELVQQIVQENPSVEQAARVVAKMENQLKG